MRPTSTKEPHCAHLRGAAAWKGAICCRWASTSRLAGAQATVQDIPSSFVLEQGQAEQRAVSRYSSLDQKACSTMQAKHCGEGMGVGGSSAPSATDGGTCQSKAGCSSHPGDSQNHSSPQLQHIENLQCHPAGSIKCQPCRRAIDPRLQCWSAARLNRPCFSSLAGPLSTAAGPTGGAARSAPLLTCCCSCCWLGASAGSACRLPLWPF